MAPLQRGGFRHPAGAARGAGPAARPELRNPAQAAHSRAAAQSPVGRRTRIREPARLRRRGRPPHDRLEGVGQAPQVRGAQLRGRAQPEHHPRDRRGAAHARAPAARTGRRNRRRLECGGVRVAGGGARGRPGRAAGPGTDGLRAGRLHDACEPRPELRGPDRGGRLRRSHPPYLAPAARGSSVPGPHPRGGEDPAGRTQLPPGAGDAGPQLPQAVAGHPLLRRHRRIRVESADQFIDPDRARPPSSGDRHPESGAGGRRGPPRGDRGRRIRARSRRRDGASSGDRASGDAAVRYSGGRHAARGHLVRTLDKYVEIKERGLL